MTFDDIRPRKMDIQLLCTYTVLGILNCRLGSQQTQYKSGPYPFTISLSKLRVNLGLLMQFF